MRKKATQPKSKTGTPSSSSSGKTGIGSGETPRPGNHRGLWRAAVLLIPVLLIGLRWMYSVPSRPTAPKLDADSTLIRHLVTSEETLLKLSATLAGLSKNALTLSLPGAGLESLFSSDAQITDLGASPRETSAAGIPAAPPSLEIKSWPISSSRSFATSPRLWQSLLETVASFEHAQFTLIDGEHPQDDASRFESTGRFEGLAKMKSGEWRQLQGTLKISWKRATTDGAAGTPAWHITRWTTETMEYCSSPKKLFVEVLDTALRNPEEAARLRHSMHYEATLKHYRDGMKSPPHPYFAPISANQKEGIAIADVDRDGWDDIYITVRLGTNMFLHNNGDGTFTEEAAARGLALPGHTTCALFADFDNDGDLDLMLGRSLLRTAYLENRGGLFFQRPSPKHFPMAVISMSAADYNQDGLLDVYLCTYRPAATAGSSPSGGVAQIDEGGFDWPDEFLSPDQAKEFRRRIAEHKNASGADALFPDLFDQLGPPNVLLINRGKGWFDVAPENPVVGIWRNSLQATWGDYDQDGDPDLYIANDWAVDNLFRNDGAAGFKDVSQEAGTTLYGFAMGASWGDYDNDGLEDLYVSNMYSEAGRRLTARIPGMNKMFAESAAGNWLYHQGPKGVFQQVAGLKAPSMTVMKAGWSWGGCFTDFDNDGFLDLYVLSGYFTAPEELASDLELESNLWRTTVRSDANLARPSFRFSPEWKRTPPPDNQGPEIDARLGGVDRQGDKTVVHSLNGHERNHYFANRAGRSFSDISALTGLDNPADSRGFGVIDYDRDGWPDVAMVNANQPLFNLYHNEMANAGYKNGMIALRFVGGNKTPLPSKEWSCRDGFGAKVWVDLQDQKLVREHRCGDGWSTQNSATMIVGIGNRPTAASVQVRWPSGKTASTPSVAEGTLLIAFENPSDSPTGNAFVRIPYRQPPKAAAKSKR